MNSTSHSSRISEIDIAKGIGILFTIIGHTTLWETPTHNFIYAFHMPLFFFLSGLIMKDFVSTSPRKEYQKLWVSYFIWSFLFCFFDICSHFSGIQSLKEMLINNTILFLSLWGISVLWFIPSLILAKCFVFFLKKVCPKLVFQLIVLSFTVLLALWLRTFVFEWKEFNDFYGQIAYFSIGALVRALTQVPFVFIGANSKTILKKIINLSPYICFLIGTLLFIIVYIISQFMGRIDIHELQLSFYPIFLLIAILGCYATLLWSHVINKFNPLSTIFTFWGRNSLFIMATHNYFFIPEGIILALQIMNVNTPVLRMTIYYILLFFIEFIIIKLFSPVINFMISFFFKK